MFKVKRYVVGVALVQLLNGTQRIATLFKDDTLRIHSLAEERVYQSSLNKMGTESAASIVHSLEFQLGLLNHPKGIKV